MPPPCLPSLSSFLRLVLLFAFGVILLGYLFHFPSISFVCSLCTHVCSLVCMFVYFNLILFVPFFSFVPSLPLLVYILRSIVSFFSFLFHRNSWGYLRCKCKAKTSSWKPSAVDCSTSNETTPPSKLVSKHSLPLPPPQQTCHPILQTTPRPPAPTTLRTNSNNSRKKTI